MLPFLCRVYALLHITAILILFTLSKYQRLVPKAKIGGTYYIKILLMDFTRESKTTFICASKKKEESVTQKEEKLIWIWPKGNYNKEAE